MHVLVTLLPLVDKTPTDNDVVAGWGGFAVFIGLCLAVAFLGWSVTRHLRIARTTVWESDEESPEGGEPPTRPTGRSSGPAGSSPGR